MPGGDALSLLEGTELPGDGPDVPQASGLRLRKSAGPRLAWKLGSGRSFILAGLLHSEAIDLVTIEGDQLSWVLTGYDRDLLPSLLPLHAQALTPAPSRTENQRDSVLTAARGSVGVLAGDPPPAPQAPLR